jgi:hypothetical protein
MVSFLKILSFVVLTTVLAKQTTHQNPINKKALHPYGKKQNPNNPVNRKEWNKDRPAINKERLKRLERLEKGDK